MRVAARTNRRRRRKLAMDCVPLGVFEGRVSLAESERMHAPFQEGQFPFPVKYGYSAVGIVEDGPANLLGRLVFALHPHQNRFVVPAEALTPVPDAVPGRRAVLAANMETAL